MPEFLDVKSNYTLSDPLTSEDACRVNRVDVDVDDDDDDDDDDDCGAAADRSADDEWGLFASSSSLFLSSQLSKSFSLFDSSANRASSSFMAFAR